MCGWLRGAIPDEGPRMTADHRRLLQQWLDRVLARPSAVCGVFTGDEGQPFGPRARPWDEPDLLIDATLTADGIRLDLDSYGVRVPWAISGVVEVVEAEHPWGPALRVMRTTREGADIVWLV